MTKQEAIDTIEDAQANVDYYHERLKAECWRLTCAKDELRRLERLEALAA